MAEENLKVAVRVRPFNQREKDANSKMVVQMQGNQTMITNPKTNEEKKFAFDYSYWSFDGFKRESNGYYSPENPKYCDQKKVYSDLGAGVLKNAWEGFNASLFAYGQTGSGKSYSVVGYPENKGIVPMVCEDIFKTKATKTGMQVEVTFSMLEIYSEIVRDLLNNKGDKKTGLQVREDPKNGFFPVGLTKTLVDSYDDISKLMDLGSANRTIAATNMNATSSRAHTIVTINLVQKYKNDAGKEMAKSSLINLVDLAGSERADQTGATGDRLKEGAAINLSLTSLGNVISALADNSSGKNARVPYRDSQLTKLLANALGGNSKTIMIAAISPADVNFDESLSTLRYADRAKQIKCKAIVNEDPTEKLIADLKAENERLKKELAAGGGGGGGGAAPAAGGDSADIQKLKQEEDALKRQLEENEKNMKTMQQSYEEKLAAAKSQTGTIEISKILEKAKTTPHLSNVNMDPSCTGTIKLLLEGEGQKVLAPPGKGDIALNGLGILAPHGTITCKGGKFTIDKAKEAKILVNGTQIAGPTDLVHRDRLLFGASQYYIFVDPSKAKPNDPYITFESMQDEIAKASGLITQQGKSSMTQDQLICQQEMIDLLPQIDEANQMSIELDKKVKFTAFAVSGESRGEFNGKLKTFVSVKNFLTDLEWIWTKDKFLDRKSDMVAFYNDMKDNSHIDNKKFKNYDPFLESPDCPTQIGTATIFPKKFAYMIANKTDYKVIDLRNKPAGMINIEILPCNGQGQPITEKDGITIHDPKTELLDKSVNFIIKINDAKLDNPVYEDIYCQFTIFNDQTLHKTDVIRGTNNPVFKFSKQLTFKATKEFLDNLLNKSIYIQVWGEQKHPKVSKANASTKDFFTRELENLTSTVVGKITNTIDPEKQRLKDDLSVAQLKQQQNDYVISNVNLLINRAGNAPITAATLKSVMNAKNNKELDSILKQYPERPGSANHSQEPDPKHNKAKSGACIIS